MTSNGPDGGFRVIAVDDRNNFRPILIPTCLVSLNFYLALYILMLVTF